MKKNALIISLIFILPLVIYFTVSIVKSNEEQKVVAKTPCNAKIIKFSSSMCRDCKKLDSVMNDVYPLFQDKIDLENVTVEKDDHNTIKLIKDYKVTLVPTLVYIYKGKILKKTEGSLSAQQLKKNMKALSDGTLR